MSLTKVSYSMVQGAFLNVLDYGADPTGANNNYQAFVDALADCAAKGIGRLVIPAGTYNLLSRVTVSTDVIIEGDGIGSTIVKSTGANTLWYPQANVVFRDMSLIQDVTDFNAYTSFSIEIRAAKKFTVERVYMEGPSYDGIYVSNPDADLRVIDCECNRFGRWALAVVDANNVYIDGFTGASTEPTKLDDGIDLEPNPGQGINTVYIRRFSGALSITGANGLIHKTIIEHSKITTFWRSSFNVCIEVVDIFETTIDSFNPPVGSYQGGTINFTDDLEQPKNHIPDSRLPGINTDFWARYYNPVIVEDYVLFDSEGSHATQAFIETADIIPAVEGDFIVFGASVKRFTAADANNSTGVIVTCYDSSGVSIGSSANLSAISGVALDGFVKQVNVFSCPAGTAFVGMTIGVGTSIVLSIGVKDAFLYKNAMNSKYVDGVIFQHLQGAAAPSTGTHFTGEVMYNSTPAAGGTIGWVCTAGGTPGTWKTFGAISA